MRKNRSTMVERFFTTVEQYFCHDGTILLSYLFGLIKACAILKKEEGVLE